ncbi:MAG: hypothetical protein HYR63_02905 [Proteobacteria bacterium]|nr:hypothetical protein [Pseudomonadota bacterium]MBI3496264.1 hypothetical protein [Pseudomonadota bacterium]
MFKGLKGFFTESEGKKEPAARRPIVSRGEALGIIDGKRYPMKSWSTLGILLDPYHGDLVPKQRSRLTVSVKDNQFNIEFDADIIVTRVDKNGLAAQFFYLNPTYKKQIEDYLKYYGQA